MAKQTHYPSYDVMREKNEWDNHTQRIVSSRVVREDNYQFLSMVEAECIRKVCCLLLGDVRGDIIQYVLCHIDQTLNKASGEGQRKDGVLPEAELLRKGCKALDQTAIQSHGRAFFHIEDNIAQEMLQLLSENQLQGQDIWNEVDQKALFQKCLKLAIEAYYSHPVVWSEMGYGGPAYPRGYIRTHLNKLDPWEAQPE